MPEREYWITTEHGTITRVDDNPFPDVLIEYGVRRPLFDGRSGRVIGELMRTEQPGLLASVKMGGYEPRTYVTALVD